MNWVVVDKLSTGIFGFVLPSFVCVKHSRYSYKELLLFLGLIHLVPGKLTCKIVFLLFLVLLRLEFCCVSGSLGKMSCGVGESCIQIPALPFISCVVLAVLLTFPEP